MTPATDTPQSRTTFQINATWVVIALLTIGFIWLFIRGCKQQNPVVNIPPTQATLDSIDHVYRDSMLAFQRERDSARSANEWLQMEREVLTAGLLRDEALTRYLNKVIAASRRDTGRTIYDLSCDSLASVSGRLLTANDSLRYVQRRLDSLHHYELAIRDTAIKDCDVAYLSAIDAAVKSNEAFEAYRKAFSPRGVLSLGVVGTWSPQQFGAGPALMYTDKRGRSFQGSYYITNGKPGYGGGMFVPIRFRKR